ncbi:MAG TPA: glycoside hydrolase family 13 protein [Paucimonas sp.]|nr:glycoside hydrolase family 13 protein [Paucimonas sp.]
MKKLLRFTMAAFATALFWAHAPLHAEPAYKIEHLEPAFWWTGMHSKQLQLLVHGKEIGALSPALDYPGVTIKNVIRVANKNYLFIDLEIGEQAKPGEFALRFSAQGKEVLRHGYRLLAREAGSAQRKSFTPADAIYLVVPDRFANGNPANDSVAGLADKADRKHPGGRHGGDLQGLGARLDYIAGLGFTMIWPTPVVQNDNPTYSYHGYGITDFYKVDERFGSNEEYRRLIAAAKAKGIGFIHDVVLNHIGIGHWWMKDLPTPDWINYGAKFVPTNHARTVHQDPYASNEDRERMTGGWFVDSMPDPNQRNPLVANYLIQNSIWWMEYAGFSGIRVDTYPYSDKAFLAAWSRRMMEEYPNLNMTGEEWSGNQAIVSYWQRGKKNHDGYVSHMPSMIDFPLHDAVRDSLGAEEQWNAGLVRLYEALANDFQYPDPGNLVIFPGNHDTSRIHSALGEDIALTKMAYIYFATMRGIPQFFYGDEILMKSPKQRDDGIVRSDFPGGWQGDAVDAFTGAGLDAQQRDMQQFVRKLLNWRKTASAIQRGKIMHYAPDNGTYVYFRHDGKQKVMVAFNKNKSERTLDTARFREMLGPRATAVDVLNGQNHELGKALTLPARSALVLEIRE